MNQLRSSIKRTTATSEAWQIIANFLSDVSDQSNQHIAWTLNSTQKQANVIAYGASRDPLKKSTRNNTYTFHMWLLPDPSQSPSLDDKHANSLPGIAANLLFAHAHIMQLQQQENTLQAKLTPRERETLSLLAKGLRSDKIAYRMGIKRVTVNLHISNARQKLKSTTREQAVARAVHMGIISP